MQLMTRTRWLAVGTTTIILSLGLSSCGDDEAEASTIPIAEWVAEFDAMCVEVIEASTPEMTDEEFAEISDAAMVEMRAIPAPDEMAETAAELLDVIDESSQPNVAEADIESLDERAFAALTALGVSDECMGGPQD